MPAVAALPPTIEAQLKNYESPKNISSFSQATTSFSPPTTNIDSASTMSNNQSSSNPILNIIEHVIDDDEEDEFDYEALPENTSITANLIAGAVAGIMVSELFNHSI